MRSSLERRTSSWPRQIRGGGQSHSRWSSLILPCSLSDPTQMAIEFVADFTFKISRTDSDNFFACHQNLHVELPKRIRSR
jgi:hypothetical protein